MLSLKTVECLPDPILIPSCDRRNPVPGLQTGCWANDRVVGLRIKRNRDEQRSKEKKKRVNGWFQQPRDSVAIFHCHPPSKGHEPLASRKFLWFATAAQASCLPFAIWSLHRIALANSPDFRLHACLLSSGTHLERHKNHHYRHCDGARQATPP